VTVENELLLEAKALYKDRIKIALSAFIILFSVSFFIYYVTGIAGLGEIKPGPGITQGLQVVAAFNNVGLLIAVALMVIAFRLWSWAFLPGPASLFTTSVLRGILGPNAVIKQSIGKRFEVVLDNGLTFSIICYIQEKETNDWFSYRLASSKLQNGNLKNIALRHGFALKDGRFTANISNDELHHRTLLMAKAMIIASASG